ncbi:hypothetical protein HOP38_02735 [Vibrio mediterranei]|uniref:hypothetical protein n=1 Tax=Vibrio mediterranei TaxID=689 RepID=UPI00178E0A8C|nr:hypothetical protein [Vibrio mediterranei]NUW71427.1 hypothetical protein [Vibrio mediterranei]
MPKYRITGPDGKTLELTGDHPPTEQELEQVFAEYSQPDNGMLANVSDVASAFNPLQSTEDINAVTNYLTNGGQQPEYTPPTQAGQETSAGAFMASARQPVQDVVNGVENLAAFALPDKMKQNIMQRRNIQKSEGEKRSTANPIASGAGYVAGTLPMMLINGIPAAVVTGGVIGAGENTNIDDTASTLTNAGLGMALAGVGEYAGTKLAENVLPTVTNKITDTVNPVINRLFRSPESSANNALRRVAGDTDANQIADELAALRGTGADVTLADTPTFRGAGQGAAAMPENSAYASAFEQRQAQAGDRIRELIHDSTGKSGAAYNANVKAINKIRSEQAKPYYDAVKNEPVQLSEGLSSTMNTPAFEDAANEAVKMAKNDMINIDLESPTQPVVFWDYVKRALDDDIGVAHRQGRNNSVRQLTNIKKQIVGEIDQQYPAYAKARSIWSESTGLLDAGEEGKQFLKTDIDKLSDTFSNLTEAERDEFRLGAVKAVEKELNKLVENANAGHRLTRSKEMQNRLSLLFDDPAEAQDLIDKLMIEKELTGTLRNLYQGSQTAQRTVAKENLEEGANFSTAAADLFSLDSRPEFRAALGEKLFTPQSPEQINRILGDNASPGVVARALGKAGNTGLSGLEFMLKRGARMAPNALDDDPLYKGAVTLNPNYRER